MRIVRFERDGAVGYGRYATEVVHPIEDPFGTAIEKGSPIPCGDLTLLAPVEPRKIIGIGRNYADHARELGNEVPASPLIFLKPGTAVIGPRDVIVRPAASSRVDFEGELAIVIGRRCRDVAAPNWLSVVAGFTCANDVTARDLQKADVQFTRGKSFDTFCPLGPWIETELETSDLSVTTRVNGEIRQKGRTAQMIFGLPEIIEFVTSIMTLEPGDVILTGTPEGVGPLEHGDEVEVEVEGIGILRNRVE